MKNCPVDSETTIICNDWNNILNDRAILNMFDAYLALYGYQNLPRNHFQANQRNNLLLSNIEQVRSFREWNTYKMPFVKEKPLGY